MKLLIQIPCYNEELSLLEVLKSLPTRIDGIDLIDIQLIDDSSTDNSVQIAEDFGVKHILKMPGPNQKKLGLAFQQGLKNAKEKKYDLLVNLDGDNQYLGTDIPRLLKPILEAQADVVIGDRNPSQIAHFSITKRLIQRLSNYTMSIFCLKYIPDAVSGFRAFNKKAIANLDLKEEYTYTIESLMQSYANGNRVSWIKIATNEPVRASWLIPNLETKIIKSGGTALKLLFKYFPTRALLYIGILVTIIYTLLTLGFK